MVEQSTLKTQVQKINLSGHLQKMSSLVFIFYPTKAIKHVKLIRTGRMWLLLLSNVDGVGYQNSKFRLFNRTTLQK